MPLRSGALLLATLAVLLGGCASRPLPKFEQPLARAAVQSVRTTAYTHSESDHQPYGVRSAAGTRLQYGAVHSAAADWSRWPSGTIFRIRETGEVCQVDDYGWALSGTNTIDLYKPSRAAMNSWGTRRVNIDILRWGDVWQSYRILEPRGKYAHVKRMLKQIASRYDRGERPPEPSVLLASTATVAPPAPVAPPPVAVAAPAIAVAPASAPRAAYAPARSGAALQPFYR